MNDAAHPMLGIEPNTVSCAICRVMHTLHAPTWTRMSDGFAYCKSAAECSARANVLARRRL